MYQKTHVNMEQAARSSNLPGRSCVYQFEVTEGVGMWFWFALGSAVFAALTSILAKVGIEGVNSNLATAIRTVVVVGHHRS